MFIKSDWPADKVTFRVGFTASPKPRRGGYPFVEGPTYWSEEVIVRAPDKDSK